MYSLEVIIAINKNPELLKKGCDIQVSLKKRDPKKKTTNKELLEQIGEQIGELENRAKIAEAQGDKAYAKTCKEMIFKLMDAREKLLKG